MLLAISVVDGFDFQLIAIALELLVLFRSAFHRQQAVRRGEKDNRVMIQPFISENLSISQTDKVFSAIAADHKRTCKKICMSVKPVRRQTVNLPGVVADNANAISPRTATFNITADKLLQCP